MLLFVKTRRLYRKIHIHLDTEHFLLYPISKRHLFSWEAPVETRSDTKRRNAFYLQQSLYSKIKRGYSFHKIMYRPTEQVERCQCCQQGVTLTDAVYALIFLTDQKSAIAGSLYRPETDLHTRCKRISQADGVTGSLHVSRRNRDQPLIFVFSGQLQKFLNKGFTACA